MIRRIGILLDQVFSGWFTKLETRVRGAERLKCLGYSDLKTFQRYNNLHPNGRYTRLTLMCLFSHYCVSANDTILSRASHHPKMKEGDFR